MLAAARGCAPVQNREWKRTWPALQLQRPVLHRRVVSAENFQTCRLQQRIPWKPPPLLRQQPPLALRGRLAERTRGHLELTDDAQGCQPFDARAYY